MARKEAMPKEQLQECEVRRLYLVNGAKQARWVVRAVSEALSNQDAEPRCKDCHGPLKLHGQRGAAGAGPHAVHKSKDDSEHCRAGILFRLAADGREHRMSDHQVE